jgi:hypothetical protein
MMDVGALDRPGGEVAMPTGASAAGAKAPAARRADARSALSRTDSATDYAPRSHQSHEHPPTAARNCSRPRITGRLKCPTARSDHPPLAAPTVSCLPPHIAHRFLKFVAILSAVFPVFLCLPRRSLRALGPVRARGFDHDDDRARLRLPAQSACGRQEPTSARIQSLKDRKKRVTAVVR